MFEIARLTFEVVPCAAPEDALIAHLVGDAWVTVIALKAVAVKSLAVNVAQLIGSLPVSSKRTVGPVWFDETAARVKVGGIASNDIDAFCTTGLRLSGLVAPNASKTNAKLRAVLSTYVEVNVTARKAFCHCVTVGCAPV